MIFSEKHELIRKLVRDFAEKEFTSDILDELDETGEFNWEMHRKMAAAGFMGTKIPKEYGALVTALLAVPFTFMMMKLILERDNFFWLKKYRNKTFNK